jgi:hypothetical protein
MKDLGPIAGNVSCSERAAFEYALQNLYHPESEPIGFRYALHFWLAVTRSQYRGQLSESIETLIVHFHNNDAFELGENLLESVRQRMQMP